MKLIRFGKYKKEKPGILGKDGKRRDCSKYFEDWDNEFFENDGLEKLSEFQESEFPLIKDTERWGSCIARPGKIIAIGLNYLDHVKETNSTIPTEPVIFLKATNSMVGPYDDIIIPKGSLKTDWEIELGIIIGKECRYLSSENESVEYIAGYTISHDVSEREFQKDRGGQWTKGKSCDTFNPVGPYLLTKDEIKNINSLTLQLKVNGDIMQNGNTKDMIFSPNFLIYYLSQFMTLEAGDLISTGTPSGVGLGRSPQVFLKDGDCVELHIDHLGHQKQICKNYNAKI